MAFSKRYPKSYTLDIDEWDTFPSEESVDWDQEEQELIAEITEKKRRRRHFVQYAVEEGNKYRPATKTTSILPSGVYRMSRDNHGQFFAKQPLNTSKIIRFPDTVADSVKIGRASCRERV